MPIDTKLVEQDATINATFPGKPGGPLVRRIGPEAMAKIVREEGPEVMTPAADSYWKDQDKRFPHLQARATSERRVFNGVGEGRRGDDNPRRLRLVGGKWMVRKSGKYQLEPVA